MVKKKKKEKEEYDDTGLGNCFVTLHILQLKNMLYGTKIIHNNSKMKD